MADAGITVERQLEAIYAKLPAMECKGLCAKSCGPIDMSQGEHARIKSRGVDIPLMYQAFAEGCLTCPALDFAGRCTVYDIRPMICRLWGVVESMPCPWACIPEGGRLSDAEGFELLRQTLEIGGWPSGWSSRGIGAEELQAALEGEFLQGVLGDIRSNQQAGRLRW